MLNIIKNLNIYISNIFININYINNTNIFTNIIIIIK